MVALGLSTATELACTSVIEPHPLSSYGTGIRRYRLEPGTVVPRLKRWLSEFKSIEVGVDSCEHRIDYFPAIAEIGRKWNKIFLRGVSALPAGFRLHPENRLDPASKLDEPFIESVQRISKLDSLTCDLGFTGRAICDDALCHGFPFHGIGVDDGPAHRLEKRSHGPLPQTMVFALHPLIPRRRWSENKATPVRVCSPTVHRTANLESLAAAYLCVGLGHPSIHRGPRADCSGCFTWCGAASVPDRSLLHLSCSAALPSGAGGERSNVSLCSAPSP